MLQHTAQAHFKSLSMALPGPPMWRLALLLCGSPAVGILPAQQPPSRAAYDVANTDSATVARFIAKLQHAAALNDSIAIASLIDYRHNIGLWDGRNTAYYSTRAQFLRAYHRIFDANLKHEIAAVTPDSLFANYQGVMFNSGRVWIYPNDNGQLLIVTINEPIQQSLSRSRRDVEASIRRLEERWRAAQQANDTAAFSELLAPDVTFIGTSGSLRDRADYIASRSRSWIPRATAFTVDELLLRFYGTVVIVTGRETSTGSGIAATGRFTHVWVRRNESWALVALQRTEIAPP